jgi:hypothetical protein
VVIESVAGNPMWSSRSTCTRRLRHRATTGLQIIAFVSVALLWPLLYAGHLAMRARRRRVHRGFREVRAVERAEAGDAAGPLFVVRFASGETETLRLADDERADLWTWDSSSNGGPYEQGVRLRDGRALRGDLWKGVLGPLVDELQRRAQIGDVIETSHPDGHDGYLFMGAVIMVGVDLALAIVIVLLARR